MKTFKKHAAQGEIGIRKIAKIPLGAVRVNGSDGHIVIGHSETGHHHVLAGDCAEVYEAKNAPTGMRVLYAIVKAATRLDHQRSFDTHEPIGLQPGTYEFRIGREYDPYAEIARQQAD